MIANGVRHINRNGGSGKSHSDSSMVVRNNSG